MYHGKIEAVIHIKHADLCQANVFSQKARKYNKHKT